MRRSPLVTIVTTGALLAACAGSGHRHVPAAAPAPTTTTVPLAAATSDSTATSAVAGPTASTTAVPPTSAAATPTSAATATTARRPVATTARPVPTTTTAKPATATTLAGSTATAGAASIGGCPTFPADNAWNEDVRTLPVDPRSATYIASISAGGHHFLHPDFGSDPSYGIPYVVTSTAPAVPVTYDEYGDESDPGPFPIPLDAPVEAGSDAHVLTVDTRTCTLFELYHGRRSGSGWLAGSGARFDLRSDRLRPDGWTSADAAGLPILPGLVRYDEVQAGAIDHALRFTVEHSQNGFIHPATHQAGKADATLPPMGLRLRLRGTVDLSAFHGEARVVLAALQRYGMIVADNGTSWYITGATDTRWDDADLDQLKRVPDSDFEVVTTGSIQR